MAGEKKSTLQILQTGEEQINVPISVSAKKLSADEKGFKAGIPAVAFPQKACAIKGIEDKLGVTTINRPANFSNILPSAPVLGFGTSLGISYDTDGENGISRMGWSLSLTSERRKIEKVLPQYFDSIDSYTYIFSGAENLLPELKVTGLELPFYHVDAGNCLFKSKNSLPVLTKLLISRGEIAYVWLA